MAIDISQVAFRGDEQLTQTRFYNDKGDLLVEDLIPTAYSKDRAAGLRWLELRDAAQLEEEALDAEEQAAASIADAPLPPDVVMAGIQSELADTRATLDAVQRSQSDLMVATPEAVIAGAAQISRVSGLASDIEARSLAHVQQAQGLVDGVIAKQSELEQTIGQLAATAGELQASTRETITGFVAEATRKIADSISKRITGFQLEAAQLRGPKGNQGNDGSSFSILPSDPRKMAPEALAQRFGRAPLGADTGAVQIKEGLQLYSTSDGKEWTPSALIPVAVNVVSQPLVINDRSTAVHPTQVVTTYAGGSGGGERLLANALTTGRSATISDTSNWATTDQRPSAGVLQIDLIGLDGSDAGLRWSMVIPWMFDVSQGLLETEAGLLGSPNGDYELNLTATYGQATAPAGVTASFQPGANAIRLIAAVVSTGGSTTQWSVAGINLLNMSGDGTAIPSGSATELPGWSWG
ncbi:hypothetical protein N9C85_01220 [Synechococcus sp. AH-224-I15]|nr:hypothetical protein [Synechococcus sp. AH-224-I15]